MKPTTSPSQSQIEAWKARKPARRMAEIPPDVVEALNRGWIETKNLVEWLRVDRVALLQNVVRDPKLDSVVAIAQKELQPWKSLSSLKQTFAIGTWLAKSISPKEPVFVALATHPSDVVREWAAVIIGQVPEASIKRRLAWIKPMAEDGNAGLREIAWMALRHRVASDIEVAVEALTPWTGSRNERVRRYASEITRPCGVWTNHITRIKESPELCLALLEPLRADSSKYVRDSVANWLNDASKSAPDWVRAITSRWSKESCCPETEAIVKRALRTIR